MAHWPLGIKSQLSVPPPAIPMPEHGHMARPRCGPPQWGRESHLESDQRNGLIEAWWYLVVTGLRRYLPDEDPRVHVKGPQPSLMSLGGHGGWPCSAEDWDGHLSWPVCPGTGWLGARRSSHRPEGPQASRPPPPTALWVRGLPFPHIPILHKSTLDLPRSRRARSPLARSP